MKIGYSLTGKVGSSGLLYAKEGIYTFTSVSPITIQPSEIMKVPIGLVLKIDPGYSFLFTTAASLIEKVCQIFPAAITLDWLSTPGPLIIPVMNCGRNPQHVMSGQPIASGRIMKVETSVEEYQLEDAFQAGADVQKSLPSKKNPGVKFELR